MEFCQSSQACHGPSSLGNKAPTTLPPPASSSGTQNHTKPHCSPFNDPRLLSFALTPATAALDVRSAASGVANYFYQTRKVTGLADNKDTMSCHDGAATAVGVYKSSVPSMYVCSRGYCTTPTTPTKYYYYSSSGTSEGSAFGWMMITISRLLPYICSSDATPSDENHHERYPPTLSCV
jgi:hypothetical protein